MTTRFGLTLALARKDWRLFWADRRAALMCFVVPVVLAAAFGTVFNRPATGAPARLPVVLVVEDAGPFTRQVAQELLSSPRLEAKEVSRAEAEKAVTDRAAVAVVLPAGFEQLKHWQPGVTTERPELHLLHHPNASAERQMAEGVVTEAVMKRVTREAFADVIPEGATLAPPFKVEPRSVSAHPEARFSSYAHSFCGMTLQYLLFWGMESGLVLLRERQRSVWTRVRVAAVPLSCVIAGKALATALVALLQVFCTFGVGYLAFGVTIGSPVGFALLAFTACALASATGLLVAAVGKTEARARNVSILVILGASMLGGLWVPSFLLPGWARDLSLALPTTWALKGFEAVTWQGGGFWAAAPSAAAVAGFALVLLGAAALKLTLAERGLRRGRT
ncbi:ABC-2 family transporter protein [Gemmata obscuriglobus]|uniref:ABC transporter permease n=1 Tax=Gemmata obscuriglobus TaxID=114 RepID=A0A2Z3H6J2_9BACT|nr:ABC transporter permease [Gemmata obscuriglobus]AWM36590.1 ABC transporter permease [Gemmata obscuriglobus]QEG30783.1 ABC-2 family transporter protein [Gemmata obscuriglobus]VTS10114.1 ABC-2 type transporter OS=Fimbriimonas ginsengisoli Gsoil 348 GN=OP10G_4703 PE=4 SV=1: ABC2_membrane_3 [Gemmata obscuriglobus UQM 2246]